MLVILIPLLYSSIFILVRAAPSTMAMYDGWLSAGCYEDSTDARVLPNQRYVAGGPSTMTVESCLYACRTDGFTVAGLEWGQECFCGTATPRKSANGCDMSCNGNPNELCGGGNRVNVYQYSNLQTYNDWTFDNCYTDSIWNRVLPNRLYVSGLMTVEKCLDALDAAGYAFGGVEWGRECWGGNVAPSNAAYDQRCDMRCEGNSSELCGGGNGLSVYYNKNTKGPSNLSRYKGWIYDNCFIDSRWNRAFPQQLFVSGPMTIEKCLDACETARYPYAGLEWSQECFCGRYEPAEVAMDGRCDMVCRGNANELCGGGNGLSVYRLPGRDEPVAPNSPSQGPPPQDAYPQSTTVTTTYTTTTGVVQTPLITTTLATVLEGTGTYGYPFTITTGIPYTSTYTITSVVPLTITTTDIIPYTTTTIQIGDVTLTSTLETTLVGSTTVEVPIVGSTTESIPLTGSTTVALPLTGSTTEYFPVIQSTTVLTPSTGTTTVPLTVGRTSFTLSIYTGTTSFVDPLTTVVQPVIILTTLARTYTTTTGSPLRYTTSVPALRPITLTGSDIEYFTTTSSAIFVVPTTSLAINTFPAVSSDIEGVTTTSTYYAPFTSETTGFIPVETSSTQVRDYTSSTTYYDVGPTPITVATEYTTTFVGYTTYTTTSYGEIVSGVVTTVAEPVTVTTTFVTRV